MHNDFSEVSAGNGYSKDTVLLQIKDSAGTYQVPIRYTAYALREPFRKEIKRQPQANQDADTPKHIESLPTWSTVTGQREDVGPWR